MTQRLRAWVGSAEFADTVLLAIGIRLAVLVVAPIAVILFGDEAARARIPFDMWNAWDAPHYVEVATVGYVDAARAVLFPLLPALLRRGSLVLPPLAVGLSISVIASVAAAIALYRLARLDGADRRVARGVVLAMKRSRRPSRSSPRTRSRSSSLLRHGPSFVPAARTGWAPACLGSLPP